MHNDTLLKKSFRYTETENNQWLKKHGRSETTDTASAVKFNPQGTEKLYYEYSQKTIYTRATQSIFVTPRRKIQTAW